MTPLPEAPPRRGGALRTLVWRLVRPVVRPIAWRVRGFMLREVRADLAAVQARLDRVSTLLERPGGAADPRLAGAIERLLLTLALEERNRADVVAEGAPGGFPKGSPGG